MTCALATISPSPTLSSRCWRPPSDHSRQRRTMIGWCSPVMLTSAPPIAQQAPGGDGAAPGEDRHESGGRRVAAEPDEEGVRRAEADEAELAPEERHRRILRGANAEKSEPGRHR